MRTSICVAVVTAGMHLFALEETINGYTWSYEIEGDTAVICKKYFDEGRESYTTAVSPRPKGHVDIPAELGGKPVTCIGDHALSSCAGLKSVTIPYGVREIGYFAFGWCESLSGVAIPESVKNIGDAAFERCSLTCIDIPASVTNIGSRVFE